MRNLDETESLKMDRKLLKPQVERRRRERMNRSLESLRALLLQGPEAASQRRVEKAEILEHTVLFLQTSMSQTKRSQHSEDASEGRQFLDGFSACLHKAALFLQTEGESRGLQASLPASLCQRLSRPHAPAPASARTSPRASAPEKRVACTRGHSHPHPYVVPPRHTHPGGLPQLHRDTHTTSQPAPGQQVSAGQCVWRPWP
ncbi:hairy and enhancer of split related-7 [Salminus brasiliensis]|uniref:hairy and enhancer of split related-7 n=1 Tax=Salminus brasiliensis TaxID=930266 RepID=UPI003B8378CF